MIAKSSMIFRMVVAISLIQTLLVLVTKAGGMENVTKVYTFVVDYSLPLKDAVKTGRYDHAEKNITDEHFPAKKDEQGLKEKSFTLYHFGYDTEYTESDWVIAQMNKDGNRPATIRELLAFAKANPDLQRNFPIVALRSVWVGLGRKRVACLGGFSSGRAISLRQLDTLWPGKSRFLAVSK